MQFDTEKLQELTPQELIEVEKLQVEDDPFYPLRNGLLKIKTKEGNLVPFFMNSSQVKLFNLIDQLRKEHKPVRILILKARQIGFSTLTEAIIYCLTAWQKNRNSLILANEKDKSNNLFDMSKLYQDDLEECHPHLALALKRSNEKKLEFEGTRSQILIASAENKAAAKSHTFQYVHISEAAFFSNYDTVMSDLSETVPSGKGIWDTIIIQETTANGRNSFYERWIAAMEGKTDWVPFFVAWWEHEEYQMELTVGASGKPELYPIENIQYSADYEERDFLAEEDELRKQYNCTEEQLNWRRWKIVNDKNGNMDLFRQENPGNWEEAFILSGQMFFDQKGMARQKGYEAKRKVEIFDVNGKQEMRDLPYGRIKIYYEVVPYEQYIVALDASEGVDKDEAAALVLNKRLNRVEAIAVGQYPPEELAKIGVDMARYYNQAIVVPENKGYGYMVCQIVFQSYGNIYRRVVEKTGIRENKLELGYNTNSVTRPRYLAQMNEEIRLGSTDLTSRELINECRTFVVKRDKDGNVKRVEAQGGFQDGLVICRAIAGTVRLEQPYIAKSKKSDAKRRLLYNSIKQDRYVKY